MNVSETVEGLERYPINLRYPQDWRDSLESLRDLPVITSAGAYLPLQALAQVDIVDGPAMIRTENARLNGWVVVDIRGRDIGSYVAEARQRVMEQVTLPAGYSVTWSGQYEYMERAKERLQWVVPVTIVLIFLLLYLCFRNAAETFMLMGSLPFAAVGGVWLLYWLTYDVSVAVAAGFILLIGLAAEFAVVMLMYVRGAVEQRRPRTRGELREAIIDGAVMRVRPKAMTSLTVVLGLSPLLLDSGPGSEAMQRIATPVVGGMISAPWYRCCSFPFFIGYGSDDTSPSPSHPRLRSATPKPKETFDMKNSMLQLVVVMGLIMAAPAVASSDHGHGKHAAHGAQTGHEHQEMRTAEGVGIVRSIAQDGSSVLVAHEPIAELRWPAMTMELALADPALAELVNTEDQIIFVLRQTGETDYEIVSLETID